MAKFMSKTLEVITLFSLLYCMVSCMEWTDCGSDYGTPKEVAVTGCDATDICTLKPGNSYTISITFEANQDTPKVVAGLMVKLDGQSKAMHIPLPNPDACKSSGLTCPLEAGSTNTYTNSVTIPQQWAQNSGVARFGLLTPGWKHVLACVQFNFTITSDL